MDPANIPRIGRLFYNANVAANTITAVLLPSANPGGLIIRTVQLIAASSSVGNGLNLFADTGPPASLSDFSRRILLDASVPANALVDASVQLPFPLYIDPGIGLWVTASSGANGGFLSITYDLLGLQG